MANMPGSINISDCLFIMSIAVKPVSPAAEHIIQLDQYPGGHQRI
jgi:hypothetical protein